MASGRMDRRLPGISFFGIAASVYAAIYPTYLLDTNAAHHGGRYPDR